jgi:hypothetical protein
VTSRAFASQLAVVLVASAAAMLAEAAAGALRAFSEGPVQALGHVGSSLGLWALPCVLASALLALLLTALIDDDALTLVLREQWRIAERRELMQVGLLLAALLVGLAFALSRSFARFRNVVLAAALLSLLLLGGLLLLLAFGYLLLRAVRRMRTTGGLRWLGSAALLVDGIVLLWLGFESRTGLAQLDGRLFAAPLAFLLGLALADRSVWVRELGRRAGAVAAGAVLLVWVSFLQVGRRPVVLEVNGAWRLGLHAGSPGAGTRLGPEQEKHRQPSFEYGLDTSSGPLARHD